MTEIRNEYFPLKGETEQIISVGMDIHKNLGFGFLEIVYKDAFEWEFKNSNILYNGKRSTKSIIKK